MNKKAEIFVAQIVLEKLAAAPVVRDTDLLMAEWLYEVMTTRRELIGLRELLKGKPQEADCAMLFRKILKAVDLFPPEPVFVELQPRVAHVTKFPDGRAKIETIGRPDDDEDLRRLNWTLSDLKFCETYPIGCRRYFADNQENLPAAVELLRGFDYAIEFYEDENLFYSRVKNASPSSVKIMDKDIRHLPEIKIGDVFKPKPSYQWYQGQTLEVVGIRFADQPADEQRFDVISSDGEPDSFWRQSLLSDFEKIA